MQKKRERYWREKFEAVHIDIKMMCMQIWKMLEGVGDNVSDRMA